MTEVEGMVFAEALLQGLAVAGIPGVFRVIAFYDQNFCGDPVRVPA